MRTFEPLPNDLAQMRPEIWVSPPRFTWPLGTIHWPLILPLVLKPTDCAGGLIPSERTQNFAPQAGPMNGLEFMETPVATRTSVEAVVMTFTFLPRVNDFRL